MLILGSKLPVGSSQIRIFGRFTTALAIATLCCSPPDNLSGYSLALCLSPTLSSTSITLFLICLLSTPVTSKANATFS